MVNRLPALIKKFRYAKGWSQFELAQKAGVGNGTIGEIESGKRKSSMKTLAKIATALDLTQEQRLSIELAFIDKDISSKNDKSLLEKIESLDKKEQEFIEKMINGLFLKK